MPTTLSQTAQDLITKAFTDSDAAAQTDTAVQKDQAVVIDAQNTLHQDLQAQSDAHQKASTSAMTALKQVASELNVTLPDPSTTTS